MGRYDACDLQGNGHRVHEERREEHAIRDRLCWHGKEEKIRLRAALVLASRVGQGHEQSIEEEAASQENSVEQLRLLLAFLSWTAEAGIRDNPQYWSL